MIKAALLFFISLFVLGGMPGPLTQPRGPYHLLQTWSQTILTSTSGTAGEKHSRQATNPRV